MKRPKMEDYSFESDYVMDLDMYVDFLEKMYNMALEDSVIEDKTGINRIDMADEWDR